MLPTSSHRVFACLAVALAIFSGGCASVYQVTVDATSHTDGVQPGRVSYHIRDQNTVAGTGALRKQEIANYLKTALSAQGLYEASDVVSADMVVEINYGIEPPRTVQHVYQELIFGRPVSPTERLGPPPEGVARQIMGYTPLIATTVVREKHLSICARENRVQPGERPPDDLWRVHVSIENESDDLRGHLPVLISAAMDHIGRTTDGEAAVTLRSDGEAIRFVRQGL